MIRVLGARVLVALPPRVTEVTTDSGLVLVRDPDIFRTPTKGIVLQLGRKSNTCDLDEVRSTVHTWVVEQLKEAASEYLAHVVYSSLERVGDDIDRVLMHMQPAPFDVQVGDCVLFLPSSGELIVEGDIEYALLHESEILAVCEPQKEKAA